MPPTCARIIQRSCCCGVSNDRYTAAQHAAGRSASVGQLILQEDLAQAAKRRAVPTLEQQKQCLDLSHLQQVAHGGQRVEEGVQQRCSRRQPLPRIALQQAQDQARQRCVDLHCTVKLFCQTALGLSAAPQVQCGTCLQRINYCQRNDSFSSRSLPSQAPGPEGSDARARSSHGPSAAAGPACSGFPCCRPLSLQRMGRRLKARAVLPDQALLGMRHALGEAGCSCVQAAVAAAPTAPPSGDGEREMLLVFWRKAGQCKFTVSAPTPDVEQWQLLDSVAQWPGQPVTHQRGHGAAHTKKQSAQHQHQAHLLQEVGRGSARGRAGAAAPARPAWHPATSSPAPPCRETPAPPAIGQRTPLCPSIRTTLSGANNADPIMKGCKRQGEDAEPPDAFQTNRIWPIHTSGAR